MAAATVDINTHRKNRTEQFSVPVKAATKIFAGTLVCVNTANGFAVPGADAANNKVVGIADEQVDNTAGADGALRIKVATGMARLKIAAGITQATVGQICYVTDDTSVQAAAPANNTKAGVVLEIDPDDATYCYVRVGVAIGL